MQSATPQPGLFPSADPTNGRPPAAEGVAALYPQHYAWYIFLSALDVLFTWVVLHADGSELNALADWVIRTYNLHGVIVYKFVLVLIVMTVCEIVGRRSNETGLKLARWAVILSAFPVTVGAAHLLTISLELRIPEA